MKTAHVVFALMFVATQLVALSARAATCELPHERLQTKCGGDMPDDVSRLDENDEALSAIQKTQRRSTTQILDDYRQKSQLTTQVVEKALEGHRLFLQQKQQ